MKTDKTTKVLMLLIALGLWLNAIIPIVRPVAAKADSDYSRPLNDISHDIHVIAVGLCLNDKIC